MVFGLSRADNEFFDKIVSFEESHHLKLTAARAKRAARAVIIFMITTDLRQALPTLIYAKHPQSLPISLDN